MSVERGHRAWHMTLLTNKILNQLVARFKLYRLSWNLGVFRLQFRVQGVAGQSSAAEIHRKVSPTITIVSTRTFITAPPWP